jgi:transcription elongation factor GreA
MSSETSYLTAEGAKKLKEELENLKGPAREELSRRLRTAIQQGDLSENADYIQAKEEQGFLEGRIIELENILRNAQIIEELQTDKSIVSIGDTVTIQEGNYEPETYFLVGRKEADPSKGRISHESPIGQAIMGHRVGDTVTAQVPSGSIYLKILEIK